MDVPLPSMRLTGIIIEISGVFLLSIEAIKIENIRLLREKFFEFPRDFLNPTIIIVRKQRGPAQSKLDSVSISFIILILMSVAVAYAAIRLLSIDLGEAWVLLSAIVPGPKWTDMIMAAIAGFVLLWLAVIVVVLAYHLLVAAFDAAIAVLKKIESHTTSGIIGGIGFMLYLTSAIMRASI